MAVLASLEDPSVAALLQDDICAFGVLTYDYVALRSGAVQLGSFRMTVLLSE